MAPQAAGRTPGVRETAERVRLLFQFSPEGYLTSAVAGVATAVFLWNEVTRGVLIAWVACVLLVCGGRYALYAAYQRRTVARVGGDEFVVMLPVPVAQDAVRVAEKILAALAAPIGVDGGECSIGVSIGIGVFPEDATDKDELLKHADRAMYHVKAAGRNSYRFYAREQVVAPG